MRREKFFSENAKIAKHTRNFLQTYQASKYVFVKMFGI